MKKYWDYKLGCDPSRLAYKYWSSLWIKGTIFIFLMKMYNYFNLKTLKNIKINQLINNYLSFNSNSKQNKNHQWLLRLWKLNKKLLLQDNFLYKILFIAFPATFINNCFEQILAIKLDILLY